MFRVYYIQYYRINLKQRYYQHSPNKNSTSTFSKTGPHKENYHSICLIYIFTKIFFILCSIVPSITDLENNQIFLNVSIYVHSLSVINDRDQDILWKEICLDHSSPEQSTSWHTFTNGQNRSTGLVIPYPRWLNTALGQSVPRIRIPRREIGGVRPWNTGSHK